MRPSWSWLEPVVVLVLGVALGLVTQQSTGTSIFLRVPALIASLILVAHAVTSFGGDGGDDSDEVPDVVISESTEMVRVQQINALNPGRAVFNGAPAADTKITTTTKTVRQDNQAVYFVMILSVWLGMATLANPGAPRMLLTLSLLASFLLFSDGYKTMRGNA